MLSLLAGPLQSGLCKGRRLPEWPAVASATAIVKRRTALLGWAIQVGRSALPARDLERVLKRPVTPVADALAMHFARAANMLHDKLCLREARSEHFANLSDCVDRIGVPRSDHNPPLIGAQRRWPRDVTLALRALHDASISTTIGT